MPKNPNPYDFVPLETKPPDRKKIEQTQGCYDNKLKTGILKCRLKTETPLFLHGGFANQVYEFYNHKGDKLIPASSLKGLLSSVAEVVSNSCLRVLGKIDGKSGEKIYTFRNKPDFTLYPHPISSKANLIDPYGFFPLEFAACDNKDELCPCCHLFGMTEKQRADDARKASSLAGRVSISDALPEQGLTNKLVEVPRGNAPRVWHHSFYFNKSKIMNGRKFYYHQSFDQVKLNNDYGSGNWLNLRAVEGAFTFNIKFHNLTDDELAILIYTIILEYDLRHHFGYGKPFGLGTVCISITSMHLMNYKAVDPVSIIAKTTENTSEMHLMNYKAVGPARYLSYTSSNDWNKVEEIDIPSWRDKGLALWKNRDKSNAYNKFKAILVWPNKNRYTYPSYNWFRNQANKEITLDTYQNNPKVR